MTSSNGDDDTGRWMDRRSVLVGSAALASGLAGCFGGDGGGGDSSPTATATSTSEPSTDVPDTPSSTTDAGTETPTPTPMPPEIDVAYTGLGGGPTRARRYLDATLPEPDPDPGVVWRRAGVGDGPDASETVRRIDGIVVREGTVYGEWIGEDSRGVVAYDAASGDREFTTRVDPGVVEFAEGVHPSVGSGVVVIADRRRYYGVDAESGDQRWAFEAPRGFLLDPVVDGERVICPVAPPMATADGVIVALDPMSGEEAWDRQLVGVVGGVSAAPDGPLVVGTRGDSEGTVELLAPDSGDSVGSVALRADETDYVPTGPPAIVGETAYVPVEERTTAEAGGVAAVDLTARSVEYVADAPGVCVPAVGDDRFYALGEAEPFLRSHRRSDGRLIAETRLPGGNVATPTGHVVTGSGLAIGAADLVAVGTDIETLEWVIETRQPVDDAPIREVTGTPVPAGEGVLFGTAVDDPSADAGVEFYR
ncbi:hypothetical protein BRD17_10255 [Halobacteriales archaeon SW_7_68_16]|nr:MAG: hypothetical protein BRD17_10255 [Halobacteriales archaeon SW_7_68_16]